MGAPLLPVDRFDFDGKGFLEPGCVVGEVWTAGRWASQAQRCPQKSGRPARD